MRLVILAPSAWSEIAVAVAVRLAGAGHAPVGALTLPTLHWGTLVRKTMQWGPQSFLRYAAGRVTGGSTTASLRNPFLSRDVEWQGTTLKTLTDAGARIGFPVETVPGMNDDRALALIRGWNADALIYTGGGILRRRVIEATRGGVLNMHAGLLPEVRGMSCPEWSLLQGIPLGATVHLIDTGVDTGAILIRRELPLDDLPADVQMVRNKIGAMAVGMLVEAVAGLDSGALRPVPQPRREEDLQHFVIHASLARLAQERLDALRRSGEQPGRPDPALVS